MADLNARQEYADVERASRRSWHRQIANDQIVQAEEKLAHELSLHRDSHAPIEYWPYEAPADWRGPVVPDKKLYGAELLLAAQQKENARALRKAIARQE